MRKGQHHSEETKAALRGKFKDKKASEEHRAKVSAGMRAYWVRKRGAAND